MVEGQSGGQFKHLPEQRVEGVTLVVLFVVYLLLTNADDQVGIRLREEGAINGISVRTVCDLWTSSN